MWSHKKFKGKLFKGSYGTDNRGQRVFILDWANRKNDYVKPINITFESWQMAKELGWQK